MLIYRFTSNCPFFVISFLRQLVILFYFLLKLGFPFLEREPFNFHKFLINARKPQIFLQCLKRELSRGWIGSWIGLWHGLTVVCWISHNQLDLCICVGIYIWIFYFLLKYFNVYRQKNLKAERRCKTKK